MNDTKNKTQQEKNSSTEKKEYADEDASGKKGGQASDTSDVKDNQGKAEEINIIDIEEDTYSL